MSFVGNTFLLLITVLIIYSTSATRRRNRYEDFIDFEEPWYSSDPEESRYNRVRHYNFPYDLDSSWHKISRNPIRHDFKERKRSRSNHGFREEGIQRDWKQPRHAKHRQRDNIRGSYKDHRYSVKHEDLRSTQIASFLPKCGMRLSAGVKRSPNSHRKHRSALHKRIVGGTESVAHSWPWQVLIRHRHNNLDIQCSGALVSKRWLITSAQCIKSKNPKDYRIRLGAHDLLKLSGRDVFRIASKVIVPPIFKEKPLVNDIAIIEISKEVPLNSFINYVCLPPHASNVKPGTKCYMTGWGRQKGKRRFKIGTKLHQLKLEVINTEKCAKALGIANIDSQICASSNDWRGGCKFDEGSPLVCYDTSRRHWVLQGIFSFSGADCQSTQLRYNIFTRISPFVNPILPIINPKPPKPPTKVTTTPSPATTKGDSTSVATIKSTKTPSTTIAVPPIPTTPKIPPVVTVATAAKTTVATKPTLATTKNPSTTKIAKKVTPARLRIHLRSEGCDDITKTDTCGRSYIVVNGIDYSQHMLGHNVVIVGYQSGKVEHSLAFNTASSLKEALKFLNFLKALGLRKVVLIAIQGDGSKYEGVLQKELVKFGATLPGEISYRSSFCLLGYSGPEQVSWISQSSMPRYKGPSEIIQEIPLPSAIKVVRIRARSESCQKTGKISSCGKSYIWVNGIDYSKHIEGHNLVTLDSENGNVIQTLGYKAKQKTDVLQLKKLLDTMPFRRIVVVVIQGDASKYHAIVRQSLGRYGASSIIELTSYSTYAFIGYSGPERVSWTTEKWKTQELGPTDVSVYIKKGLYVCGLQYYPPLVASTFVVGGKQSRQGAWPWMGAIVDGNGRFVCGSSLVHRQWVVTAAHCIILLKQRPGPHKIVLGDRSYVNHKALKLEISKIVQHPKYNPRSHSNDIAMMKLEKAAPVKESIRLICLNERNQFKTGKLCYIIGWGKTSQGGTQTPLLRHAAVPLVSHKVCNHERSYRGLILSNMLCAGYAKGGVDACQGDSGGPLACQNRDGYWFLTGVVSWGHGCAQPHKYGVYVKVSKLAPWIRETISKGQG